jgi:hypothetical protein
MHIITGPVLGQACQQNVRILVETDEDGTLQLEASPKNKNLQQTWKRTTTLQTKRFKPVVAELSGFTVGAYTYKLSTPDGTVLAESVFTIRDPNVPIKTLVVSCNALHTLKPGDVDLWASMLQHHGTDDGMDVDLLLHIGDQIYEYTRDVWERCYKMLVCLQTGGGKCKGSDLNKVHQKLGYSGEWRTQNDAVFGEEEVHEAIRDLFRSVYRQYWNHPPMKAVLSRIANHMIMDDHDVRNGWGILPEDRSPGTLEYTLGLCAHDVYQEYQVQLWRNIDKVFHVDYRVVERGDTALFLMDVRNPRTFCYHENAPYVGPEQMRALEQLLRDTKLRHLMVVCSIPILMASESHTDIAASVDLTYDTRDTWTVAAYRPEHLHLLSVLEEWKRQDLSRSIVLVGGDIHFALYSSLSGLDGQEICTQVVTSPITNEPTMGFTGWLQDLFVGKEFTLYNRFRVTHKYSLHARNYAEIFRTKDGWDYRYHTEKEDAIVQ